MVCVERPPSNPLSRIDCSQIGNPHLQAALPSSCERGQGDDRGSFRRCRLGRCRCYDTVDAVSKLRPANLIFPCMGNVRDYVAFREGAKTCRGNTQQPSFSLPQPRSLRRGRAALQAIADDQREDARSGPSRCRPIAQQPSQSNEFINRAAEQPVLRYAPDRSLPVLPIAFRPRSISVYDFAQVDCRRASNSKTKPVARLLRYGHLSESRQRLTPRRLSPPRRPRWPSPDSASPLRLTNATNTLTAAQLRRPRLRRPRLRRPRLRRRRLRKRRSMPRTLRRRTTCNGTSSRGRNYSEGSTSYQCANVNRNNIAAPVSIAVTAAA